MAIADAYDTRFLESAENVKRVIARTFGRKPNAEISRGIAIYIQQGRMFFESALDVPMEIRPLPLYYGMMAFAKAIIASRGFRSPSSLCQKHGLKDITLHNAALSDLKVRFGPTGTFQEFNDAICEHEGIDYFENAMSRRHILQTASSRQLVGVEITLKEILSHITGLQDLFNITFGEDAQVLPFNLYNHGALNEIADLRIDVPKIFDGVDSLRQIIEEVREKFPILRRWRFFGAQHAWDNSVIVFRNTQPPVNELATENIAISNGGQSASALILGQEMNIDFRELLEPTCCGLTQSSPCFAVKIDDSFISDTSLQYVGMFLLGSLVRYQPQIWVHSVSRYASNERPADDQALALIEQFMNAVQGTFPKLVVRMLTQT